MKSTLIKFHFFLLLTLFLAGSCQKEIDGTTESVVLPVSQKPKLGTLWSYIYTTYYATGGVQASKTLNLKAKTQETLGGEQWLNIVDVDTDTTVYRLNTKAGGLYQYTNSSSYLLCKYPAALNDSYTSFNDGGPEDFVVKGVNDSLPSGIGSVPVNYYEGTKSGFLIDLIWYNDNAWIVRKITYLRKPAPSTAYYRYSTMYIASIVY